MPGPDRPGVHEPALGSEGVEDGLQPGDVVAVASHHQAEPLLEPPDAAAHTGVDEAQASLGQHAATADRLLVVGVAAVDHQVAGLQQAGQLVDGGLRRVAGGHHHPRQTRRGQGLDQVGQRRHLRHVGSRVEAHHLVTAAAEPLGHARTHPAQTDHAQLH